MGGQDVVGGVGCAVNRGGRDRARAMQGWWCVGVKSWTHEVQVTVLCHNKIQNDTFMSVKMRFKNNPSEFAKANSPPFTQGRLLADGRDAERVTRG